MTKPWISDSRQRASKRYQQTHAALVEYVIAKRNNRPDPRQQRHREKSEQFRKTGDHQ